ncbi:hypothetical protein J437_LFUL002133 [Ladona fulva]|uniref:Uncharacterized protein n=1 Tax=Ladona fulva TaxID=123851 RepID=A0A8K0JT07_LADFU|nr:hypothetical protein J437_LFUL002133 [Ladona fulva]
MNPASKYNNEDFKRAWTDEELRAELMRPMELPSPDEEEDDTLEEEVNDSDQEPDYEPPDHEVIEEKEEILVQNVREAEGQQKQQANKRQETNRMPFPQKKKKRTETQFVQIKIDVKPKTKSHAATTKESLECFQAFFTDDILDKILDSANAEINIKKAKYKTETPTSAS